MSTINTTQLTSNAATYTVEEGNMMWDLAKEIAKRDGSTTREAFVALAEANEWPTDPYDDFYKSIDVGQVVKLPAAEEEVAAEGASGFTTDPTPDQALTTVTGHYDNGRGCFGLGSPTHLAAVERGEANPDGTAVAAQDQTLYGMPGMPVRSFFLRDLYNWTPDADTAVATTSVAAEETAEPETTTAAQPTAEADPLPEWIAETEETESMEEGTTISEGSDEPTELQDSELLALEEMLDA